MANGERYSFYRGPALTRTQWLVVLVALVAAVVGVVIAALGDTGLGAALLGLAGMTLGITRLIATDARRA